ncbi:MAG: NAD-dependent deacylase [Pseudomonadota bacterium]
MTLPTELVSQLSVAKSLVVLSGAGLSAESGLATFRDAADAHWAKWRPEDLATPEAFASHPDVVWRWYRERRQAALAAKPNPAHMALAELERRIDKVTIVTQNVDGLLQRAGVNDVVEFHGNLFIDRCSADGADLAPDDVDMTQIVPRCRRCGAAVRPGVVWFGEAIPANCIERAFSESSTADGMLVVGTSALVAPANSLASVARDAGAWVAEINVADTAISGSVEHVLRGRAGDILPQLVALLPQGI